MQFIDTHLHLQDYKQKCATDIINSAINAGAEKLVCVSAIESDWNKIAKLHNDFSNIIIPAFGLHPWYTQDIQLNWESRLSAMLEKYPNALIGECGLDRLHNPQAEPQKDIFQKHIILAKTFKRPLLIHAIKSQDWLEDYWQSLPQKFVFHSYNGRVEMLNKVIKVGGYISFSASILKNRDFEEVAKAVPQDKLLLETDSPYQPLVAGTEIEPTFILNLAEQIAKIRGDDFEQLSKQIYQNSEDFIKPW